MFDYWNEGITNNFVKASLILIIICTLSYGLTVENLEYLTNWRWPQGQKGGALNYQWFGISTVYHSTPDNGRESIFWFPDITSYILIALLVLNLLHFNAIKTFSGTRLLAGLSIGVVAFGIIAYADLMMFISSNTVERYTTVGVVHYVPFLLVQLDHFFDGGLTQRAFDQRIGDFTMWLLIILIILTIIIWRKGSRS